MSLLGFDKILRGVDDIEKRFLSRGMDEAQKEFAENFSSQSDKETKQPWQAVVRPMPPPILDVTGALRKEALSRGNVTIMRHKAVLVIDPIDPNKRTDGGGYASFHMDGTNRMVARPFATESTELLDKLESILIEELNKEF